MKKYLLLFISVMVASASFAQAKSVNQKIDKRQISAERALNVVPSLDEMIPVKQSHRVSKAPFKAEAYDNGVWFARPEGTLVTGTTDEGYGYYVNRLVVAPFNELLFKNMSDDPLNTWWTINGTEYEAEENGDFYWGTPGCYLSAYDAEYDEQYTLTAWYVPELTDGGVTYRFGEPNNDYYEGTRSSALLVDSITTLCYVDDKTTSAGYAFGRLTGGKGQYLFGSGNYTFIANIEGTDTTFINATCAGFVDYYPKPQSSLYVEHIGMDFYTATQLLSNGAELTLRVVACEENENGELVLTDRTIAELTATEDDVIRWGGPYTTSYTTTGECYYEHAVFKKTVTDEIGNVYDEPFAINEPFAIIVTGFENPDVDGTGIGEQEADEDHQTYGLEGVWATADGDSWAQTIYGGTPLSLAATFYGCFDYVEAQDTLYAYNQLGEIEDVYPNLNVLRISADGQTCATDGVDEDHSFEGAIFYTAFSWFDEFDMENYFIVEDIYEQYPWISDWSVIQYVDSDGDRTGMNEISFVCEPLPDGVTGRQAVLHFAGKGYESALPVVLLQGDAQFNPEELGIKDIAGSTVSAFAKNAYSLTGSRVKGSYKGITIQNGKKYIRK